MRGIALCLLVLAAAGCERHQPDPAAKAAGSPAAREERIACKLAGAAAFAPDCSVDRARRGGIETLVVRHPDGGFRRFDVLEGGRGIAIADGATQAVTSYADGFAELAVDGDSYRFPIKVKAAPSDAPPR